MRMIIIIAGCRNFNNYEFFKRKCDKLLSVIKTKCEITIISGGALGVDTMAEKYSIENNYNFKEYPADWRSYPRNAGIIRNCEMGTIADRLIAFWDQKSSGTRHMISEAKRKGLKIKVVNI